MGLWEMSQQDPDFTDSIVTAFGIQKLPIMRTPDIARICRKRIEQAKEMLEQELATQQIMTAVTGQEVDNTNLAASIVSRLSPPISPKEPFFQQKVQWLSELLDADEMQFAPEELRYIIEEMMDVHLQVATLGQAQMALDQSIPAVMANLPMLIGEQAMNEQNQQLEQQFAMEQQQAQAEQQANDPTAKMQLANDERQRQHDMTMQERELADNAEERKNSIEQAKLQNSAKAKQANDAKRR